MNYHKKVQVGGDLGAELERIWAAIRSNQIKTSPGQRINRTPSGTTISFGTGNAEEPTESETSDAILVEVYPFADAAPLIGQPLSQLAVWMRLNNTLQLVLLPPVGENLLSTFEHDGRHFPSVLYDGTNSGSSWAWIGIGSLVPTMRFEVKKFGSSLDALSQSHIASGVTTDSPHRMIRYYIDPDQFTGAGGWFQI